MLTNSALLLLFIVKCAKLCINCWYVNMHIHTHSQFIPFLDDFFILQNKIISNTTTIIKINITAPTLAIIGTGSDSILSRMPSSSSLFAVVLDGLSFGDVLPLLPLLLLSLVSSTSLPLFPSSLSAVVLFGISVALVGLSDGLLSLFVTVAFSSDIGLSVVVPLSTSSGEFSQGTLLLPAVDNTKAIS